MGNSRPNSPIRTRGEEEASSVIEKDSPGTSRKMPPSGPFNTREPNRSPGCYSKTSRESETASFRDERLEDQDFSVGAGNSMSLSIERLPTHVPKTIPRVSHRLLQLQQPAAQLWVQRLQQDVSVHWIQAQRFHGNERMPLRSIPLIDVPLLALQSELNSSLSKTYNRFSMKF